MQFSVAVIFYDEVLLNMTWSSTQEVEEVALEMR